MLDPVLDATALRSEEESTRRFNLRMQMSRAGVFTIALFVAVLLHLIAPGRYIVFPLWIALGCCGIANLSALIFYVLYKRGYGRKWPLHWFWMPIDAAFASLSVYATGSDPNNPWFIWYLVNVTAAAFAVGRRWALAMALVNTAGYVLIQVIHGNVDSFDEALQGPIMRLMVLYGVSFFFVRGISSLRDRNLLIHRLARQQAQQMAELQRLTREVEMRSEELARANVRIREADRMKSQFLANMSHELRTPLNSIIGFSEILNDKLQGKIEPRQQRFLGNILASGQHLLGLINDILDLSKIEAGKMELHFEPLVLEELAVGVKGVMAGMAGKRGITIRTEIQPMPGRVVADGPKVKQVLYNLLSNAVKFSPDQSEVVVDLRPLAAEASPLGVESYAMTVHDQGIGIRTEDHEAVFQEFRQLDQGADRRFAGTGLGLALVRKFVELHGGVITLASELGKGSTFRVVLPMDASRAVLSPETEPAPPAPALSGAPTVLVVEDDDTFFTVLAADLEAAGYRPLRAVSGEEAVEVARRERVDVISLDLVLPGMDGWSVLKQLKADAVTAAIPVVVVSMMDNHELGFALGADDYFIKPVNRGRFLDRVRELVAQRPDGRPLALSIDDDPDVHDLLEADLDQAGWDLIAATNGPDGLALASSRRPDLIILDLMMPGMNGFEVAEALKKDPVTAPIPIIVLTAGDPAPADRSLLMTRVRALLTKDENRRQSLSAAIRDLERHRAQEAPHG